jgi:hypothetical protein
MQKINIFRKINLSDLVPVLNPQDLIRKKLSIYSGPKTSF